MGPVPRGGRGGGEACRLRAGERGREGCWELPWKLKSIDKEAQIACYKSIMQRSSTSCGGQAHHTEVKHITRRSTHHTEVKYRMGEGSQQHGGDYQWCQAGATRIG